MAAAASWAAKLRLHNQKHPPAPQTEGRVPICWVPVGSVSLSIDERRKEEERLFEEEYTRLRGEAEKKYDHIPRFYSKVIP